MNNHLKCFRLILLRIWMKIHMFFTLFSILISIELVSGFKFYLKQPDGDLYMGKPGNDVYFTEFENADVFEIKSTSTLNYDFLVVDSKDKHVLDVTGNGTRIIYWPEHGAPNQKFQLLFRKNNRIKIHNVKGCVSYHKPTSKFELWPCKENDTTQEFLIQPVETEKDDKWLHLIPVSRVRLEALKRSALKCDEIKEEMGAEAIAELGETAEETKLRLSSSGMRSLL